MSNKRNESVLENGKLKKSIFVTPEGYFERLTEQINAEIITEQSALMNNPQLKKAVFLTPPNYFNDLQTKINSRIKEVNEVKVISIYRSTWFKLAAAAVILFGIIMFGLPKQNQNPNLLADVSDSAIIDYLEEKQAIEIDLLATVTDLSTILDNMILDETSTLSFASNDNPELDYDFQYLDY
jgi:hypothetical protein